MECLDRGRLVQGNGRGHVCLELRRESARRVGFVDLVEEFRELYFVRTELAVDPIRDFDAQRALTIGSGWEPTFVNHEVQTVAWLDSAASVRTFHDVLSEPDAFRLLVLVG